ncbi:MAG: chemotaxis response regulator protein-glutamate methylesterase [Betaproteobacteria bacterium]|nr:chemotaxis response regulator protein-glutamate methylesterase [Betaproteobacteria bacterium]
MAKTRVVVVDDSALVRGILSQIINAQPDLETVGAAPDPIAAREMIRALDPDVITLDVEMPRMDGLDFLERLMRLRPTPVVMVSTLTERGAETTFRALELGAVDFVAKPRVGIAHGLDQAALEIVEKIRAASKARVQKRTPAPSRSAPVAAYAGRKGTEKIIAVGASTGGTEAIRTVLCGMPGDGPAVVITQHMPPGFTKSFSQRLDSLARMAVKEAEEGERILPGHAYVAPGGMQFAIEKSGANYVARVWPGEPVNRHRPSVDVLFRSVARVAGANALGVMLTGMGRDGADAMLEMKRAGAFNLAQDEASCVVFGMPREAIAVGATDEVLPLEAIAGRLMGWLAEHVGHHVRV